MSDKSFPQRLNADLFSGLIGTTELVPCYKAFGRLSLSAACAAVPFQN
jgi:hypothetical protein